VKAMLARQASRDPFDLNLWETSEDPQRPGSVVVPLDPAPYQCDPLLLM
jgi:hypothetical protein